MNKFLKSVRLWVVAMLLLIVLAVIQQPSGNGVATRIQHLEQLVKCPSCENLSVYDSNSTSAIAVRAYIAKEVKRGTSDTKILTTLQSQYGPTILLSPSTSGLGAILWLAPMFVVLVLVGILSKIKRKKQ
jgi:cytochrome c-type biogenesis protein CcmH